MKKNKIGGFVLVETLIVTVFVAAIFSIIFLNFYPLIGEYERREDYDDVNSKYAAYWVKKMIQDSELKTNILPGGRTPINYLLKFSTEAGNGFGFTVDQFCNISGESFFEINSSESCSNLLNSLHVENIVITSYSLSKFKDNNYNMGNSFLLSTNFKDYIGYLPKYTAGSLTGAKYRVLVEFKHERPYSDDSDLFSDDITEYPYYTYATLEVVK